jgi:hypothetical protein
MSEDKPKHNPQKYSWKVLKTYDNYPAADAHRISLIDKGHKKEEVKVNRRGIDGLLFAVRVGTLVKKEEEETNEES